MSLLRRILASNLSHLLKATKPHQNYISLRTLYAINNVICTIPHLNLQTVRFKSKGKKTPKRQDVESESEEEEDEAQDQFEDQLTDKQTKVMVVHVNSLRVDGILRAGLGIARNKIETLFYESKIRVNEQKILKKSASVGQGDVVDIIKGVNETNDNLLTVARVEILNITEKGDNLSIKVRRCKNLLVENYDKAGNVS